MKSETVTMGWEILDRMELAVAKVRERLLRATAALNLAGVAYAVVSGHAVASWVAQVDEGAVRGTRDMDLLVLRDDLPVITAALQRAGFVPEETLDATTFRDERHTKPVRAIRLFFSSEKVRPNDLLPAPDLATVPDPAGFRVLVLESLLVMMLTLDRNEDAMHIRDLIGVGLVDASWMGRVPPVLAGRLQHILDAPDG